MKLNEKLDRFFQTEAHVAREAKRIADSYFPAPHREIARCVVLSLVSALCVNVEQITSQTDIVKDLCADEKWEWDIVILSIEESVGRKFPTDRHFEGRTVADLVEFVAVRFAPSNEEKA